MRYAKALKHALGTDISITLAHAGRDLKTLYGYGEEYFDQILKKDGGSLSSFVSNAVNETRPDIVHSHNAPDHMTIMALKQPGDVPVIHDTHEVLSVHHSGFFSGDDPVSMKRYGRQERLANELSHARIYPTEGIREYIQHRYAVNERNDLVFPNYMSRKHIPESAEPKLSERDDEIHIAYVGCVTSLLKTSHYYLVDVFKEIAKHRWHIHIHPTTDLITSSNRTYRMLASKSRFIHYHRHMDRKMLLRKLKRYDYGWAGLNRARNREHLEMALPNKVVEYVACGLPVLAFPHSEIRQFIENNHVGIVGKDVDDLAKHLASVDICELKSSVEKYGQGVVIEKKIWRLIDFYTQVAAGQSG